MWTARAVRDRRRWTARRGPRPGRGAPRRPRGPAGYPRAIRLLVHATAGRALPAPRGPYNLRESHRRLVCGPTRDPRRQRPVPGARRGAAEEEREAPGRRGPPAAHDPGGAPGGDAGEVEARRGGPPARRRRPVPPGPVVAAGPARRRVREPVARGDRPRHDAPSRGAPRRPCRPGPGGWGWVRRQSEGEGPLGASEREIVLGSTVEDGREGSERERREVRCPVTAGEVGEEGERSLNEKERWEWRTGRRHGREGKGVVGRKVAQGRRRGREAVGPKGKDRGRGVCGAERKEK